MILLPHYSSTGHYLCFLCGFYGCVCESACIHVCTYTVHGDYMALHRYIFCMLHVHLQSGNLQHPVTILRNLGSSLCIEI